MLKYLKRCPICNNSESFKYERTLNTWDLFKCNLCSFVFADIPNDEALRVNSTIADKIDIQYQENQTGIDKLWFKYFARKVSGKLPNKGKLLDIGCGNGVLLSILKDFGWTVFGNDLSPWAQKYADKIGYTLYNQLIEDINFNNEFHCIVSTSTFEHVVNPLEHLSTILASLKSGGDFWVTIPNYNSLSIKLNISRFDYNQPPFHVNYFTPKALKKLFKILQKEYDFSYRIRTYGIPELFSFYIFLKKFLKKSESGKEQPVTSEVHSCSSKKIIQVKKQGFLKVAISKLIVILNYHLGRPFLVGDKIEFYLRKK